MRTRTAWRLAAVGLILAVAGCGGRRVEPSASTLDEDWPSTTAEDGESDGGGISVEEAESLDVLTGAHDALLQGPTELRAEDGCVAVTLELLNVGYETDRYEITVEPTSATFEPDSAVLEAGARTEVSVRTCGQEEGLVVAAHSEARDEIVAQYVFDIAEAADPSNP